MPLCDWEGKKGGARPTSPRVCYFFDDGYPAGASLRMREVSATKRARK